MLSSSRLVLLIGTACLGFLFLGCQTMSNVGNAMTSDDSTGDVRRNKASVADCEFIEEIKVNTNPRIGDNTTEDMLSNKAASVGGNVVLITKLTSREAEGEAYKCTKEDEKKKSDDN